MRIIQVTQCYYPSLGGSQTLARAISEKMTAKGHKVCVITSARGGGGGFLGFGEKIIGPARETLDGVEIIRSYGNTGWYDLGNLLYKILPESKFKEWLLWQILKIVRWKFRRGIETAAANFKPDITLLNAVSFSHSVIFLEAYQNKPFPYVVIPAMHGDQERTFSKTVRELLQNAKALLVPTNYEADLAVKLSGQKAKKIFVAGLGSDVPENPPAQTDRQPWVLYFGRLSAHKGTNELYEAMKLVWKQRPDAKLIFAGANPKNQPWVTGDCEEFKNKIQIYNNVPEKEKEMLLASAACLAFPSKSESFGIATLESWKYKLPVIVLDIPVMREIVSEGADGFLVSKDDIPALAEKILFFLNNPEAVKTMGEAGFRKICARFSWSNFVDTLEETCRFAVEHK